MVEAMIYGCVSFKWKKDLLDNIQGISWAMEAPAIKKFFSETTVGQNRQITFGTTDDMTSYNWYRHVITSW